MRLSDSWQALAFLVNFPHTYTRTSAFADDLIQNNLLQFHVRRLLEEEADKISGY